VAAIDIAEDDIAACEETRALMFSPDAGAERSRRGA